MKKTLLLNRTLFLVLGVILLIPVFGIKAGSESAINYDVNPHDYSINVNTGDSRVYVFQQIRISSHNESMWTETNEMEMEMQFGGMTENKTINEGTKLRLDVVGYNDTYIELSQIYYLLDGPVYYPNNLFVDRSSLELRDDSGPRFIMTTNDSLINQVYDGNPEWNKDLQPDFIHFSQSDWNDTEGFGSSEDYEYDSYSGFLRNFRIHNSYENGHMDIELRSSFEINPDDYILGVTVGDSQFYTLNRIKFYDWERDSYFHDIPFDVKQGESIVHQNLFEGDRIYVEVTNTSGDYVKFKIKLYPKNQPEIIDDTVHIMDKTTGYFSLNRILHGPPILVTINSSLVTQYAPYDMDITENEFKYNSYWQDSDFEQSESGSWDRSTGWLNSYKREEKKEGIVRHEFEIIAGNHTSGSEFAVGVKAGESNTLQFTDILQKNEDGSSTEDFSLTATVEGADLNLTMKVGDKLNVFVKEVNGYNITLYMVFHSSVDGEVTGDSWTVNIAEYNMENNQGPMFIIPTDPKIIDDMFKEKANVTYDGTTVYVDSEMEIESKTYITRYVYDITTGWVKRMSQSTEVNGVVEETFAAESVGTSTPPEKTTTNPSLTPISLWPTILFLIIAAPLYRRKR